MSVRRGGWVRVREMESVSVRERMMVRRSIITTTRVKRIRIGNDQGDRSTRAVDGIVASPVADSVEVVAVETAVDSVVDVVAVIVVDVVDVVVVTAVAQEVASVEAVVELAIVAVLEVDSAEVAVDPVIVVDPEEDSVAVAEAAEAVVETVAAVVDSAVVVAVAINSHDTHFSLDFPSYALNIIFHHTAFSLCMFVFYCVPGCCNGFEDGGRRGLPPGLEGSQLLLPLGIDLVVLLVGRL